MPEVITASLSKLASQLHPPLHIQTSYPPTSSPSTANNANHSPQTASSPPSSTTPQISLDTFAESLNSTSTPGVSLSDFTSKDSLLDAQQLANSLASFAPTVQTNDNTSNSDIASTLPVNATPTPAGSEPTDEEYANITPTNMKRMMGRLKMKGGHNLVDLKNMMDSSKAKKDSIPKESIVSDVGNVSTPLSSALLTDSLDNKTKSRPKNPEAPPLAPELADLTREDESSNTTISGSRSWKCKYTLRSHFDGVWSLVFHPTDPVLLSGSEDGTWKMWNLQSLAPSIHKPATTELEPIYTFRGHTGPVYSLCLGADKGKALSAGGDGVVRVWTLPPITLDPYERHGVGVDYRVRTLEGHTDAIWSLAAHPYNTHVLSASADTSVRLWDYERSDPLLHTLTLTDSGHTHTPTSVDVVYTNLHHCIASYTSGSLAVFDMETGRSTFTLIHPTDDPSTQINKVISHPTLSLAITAHEDKKIAFLDLKSGKIVHTMVGHLDAVSSLAIDPSALYLLSAGHDSSLRFWDITTRTCVQEMNVWFLCSFLFLFNSPLFRRTVRNTTSQYIQLHITLQKLLWLVEEQILLYEYICDTVLLL